MRPVSLAALLAVSFSPLAAADAQIAGKRVYDPAPPPVPFIGDNRSPRPGIGRELWDVRGRVEEAREKGTISRREARSLRREERVIGSLARRYGRDGFSDSERVELETRALYLREAINRAALE